MTISTDQVASTTTQSMQAGRSSSSTSETGQLADQDTFLQLLIAQIKNQDPLNPADGVEFLTQLAQFTELEQVMGIRGELEALRQLIENGAPSV